MSSFLDAYQRQPKLFIDLPSKGKFYEEGKVLDSDQIVQIPVFGMNAMDEILFKTPDALFSGRATAEVIHSCIPTVVNPWELVGYDIDYVLIAMRIATYGDKMPVSSHCPKCSSLTESQVSLMRVLEGFENYPVDFSFKLKELTFKIKPLTYKQTTEYSIENYTHERELFQISKIEDDDARDKAQQVVYKKQQDLNLRLATAYIDAIYNDENEERDINVIRDFIKNNDVEFYETLKNKIYELTHAWSLPKFDISCANEECNHEYKTKISVDYSSFFGVSSLISRTLI